MKRILDCFALVCCLLGFCVAYDPTRGVWDKAYLALLVPITFFTVWGCVRGD